jgi:RNA polymerase sigma factor (sigma-70 family)
MRTDDELLGAWREGDAASGRELFERYFEPVFRFFRNKAASDIEDLVQSTFASCLASRDAFRGESSFRTYLFTIARNELYADWRKRSRRGAEVDVGSISVEDLRTTPGTALAARLDRALLARALRSIPLDLQVALELHYWEELTGPELATVLGVPEGTARSRLRRGREELATKVEELRASGAAHEEPADLEAWLASLKGTMAR